MDSLFLFFRGTSEASDLPGWKKTETNLTTTNKTIDKNIMQSITVICMNLTLAAYQIYHMAYAVHCMVWLNCRSEVVEQDLGCSQFRPVAVVALSIPSYVLRDDGNVWQHFLLVLPKIVQL